MSLNIPVYSGINDNPLSPNENNNCNADYFIDKYNKLVNISTNVESIYVETDTYYLNTTGGLNTNSGKTIAQALRTNVELLYRTTPYNYNILNIYIEGPCSTLNLKGIKANKINIFGSNSSNLALISTIEFSDYNKNVAIDLDKINIIISSNIFWNLNSCKLTILNSRLTTGKFIRTVVNRLLTIRGGSIEFDRLYYTNNLSATPGIFIENSTVILSNIVILPQTNFPLFDISRDSSVILNLSTNYVLPAPMTKLVRCNGNSVEVVNGNNNYATIAGLLDGSYTIDYSTNLLKGRDNKLALESLTGADRLNGSAIQNIAGGITGIEVRDKLISLSGNDRLDAANIKNINNVNYYTTTSAEYTQPAINSLVSIQVVDSSFLGVGNYILIENSGIYRVENVINSSSVSVRNLGYIENVAPGSVVINGKKITITGRNGVDGYTNTTANFILPMVGEEVEITVDNRSIFAIHSVVVIDGIDYFRINDIGVNANSLICERLGYFNDVADGATVISGSKIVTGGIKGERGVNSYTAVSTSYIQPDVLQDVVIEMASTSSLLAGITVYIDNGGYYLVNEIISLRSVSLKNLDYAENKIAGTSVGIGNKVIVVGSSINSYSYTTEEFIVPSSYNGLVNITMFSTDWLAESIIIVVAGGYFRVENIISNTVISGRLLEYPSSTIVLGSTIPIDNKVVISGERGEKGDTGQNVFTSFDTFVMPAIGSTIVLMVDNSEVFIPQIQVFVEGAGIFEVEQILTDTSITLRNIGTLWNEPAGTTINSGKIVSVGKSHNGYYVDFVGNVEQPSINDTTTIQCVTEISWLEINSYIYINGLGYLLITAIDNINNILTVKNNYYSTNAIPTSVITDGRLYLVVGDIPKDNVVATTTSEYIQPAINSDVVVDIYTSEWLYAGMIITGLNSGYYEVLEIISGTSARILNLGYNFNNEATAGTTITSNTKFVEVGARGPTGYNATYSYVNTSFVQPAVNSNVVLDISDTSWISIGQNLYIEGGGYYEVVAIDSITSVTVKNLDIENTSNGSTIIGNGGQRISPSGRRGQTGITGSVESGTYLTLLHQVVDPSAITNSVRLYSKQDELLYSIDSLGIQHIINQDLEIGNVEGNIVSISELITGLYGINLGSSNNLSSNSSILNIIANGSISSAISLNNQTNTNNVTITVPSSTDTYTLTLPGNSGSDGYILTTDGTGITEWTKNTGGLEISQHLAFFYS